VPQVLPPPLLPLLPLLPLPPLLPVPLLLPVVPPLLLDPPLLPPVPMPQTPPRGTQALTSWPELVLRVVHTSSALQLAPAQDAAQYESLAICTQ
jgi:hypothetical protein